MQILGIDPGTRESAFVVWDDEAESIIEKGIHGNPELVRLLAEMPYDMVLGGIAIEMIDNNGQAVGNDTFETVLWIGVFLAALGVDLTDIHRHLVYRRRVKLNLCGAMQGVRDAHVSMALRNRFGEKGTKKNPGKLYGIRSHEWSALAVAVTYSDQQRQLAK